MCPVSIECSGHPDTKACPPTPSHLFPVTPRREVDMDVQTRHISRTVEDRGWVTNRNANRKSHICGVDWHNRWPWVTLNGCFSHRGLLCGSWASCSQGQKSQLNVTKIWSLLWSAQHIITYSNCVRTISRQHFSVIMQTHSHTHTHRWTALETILEMHWSSASALSVHL